MYIFVNIKKIIITITFVSLKCVCALVFYRVLLILQVFPKAHVISALTTVFEYNVLRFHNGRLGAVNGMRPDGKVGHQESTIS